jgi:hypothetical protein
MSFLFGTLQTPCSAGDPSSVAALPPTQLFSPPAGNMNSPLRSLTHLPAGMTGSMNRRHARRRNQPSGSSDALRAAGGSYLRKSLAFNIEGSYPNISKTVSPYNQIRVQSTFSNAVYHTTSTTVPTYNSQYLAINQFSSYLGYTSVFDQYCIEKAEIWLYPAGNQYTPGSTAPPSLITCVDLDDANVPTTLGNVSDHQESISTGNLCGHYHMWQPQYATAVYSGSFTSFGADRGWLDCASPGIQHYGFKLAVQATPGQAIAYALTARITVAFRSAGLS